MNAPPVARFALAYAAGVSWRIAGAPLWTAPLLLVLYFAWPIRASRGPNRASWALLALLAAATGQGIGDRAGCSPGAPGTRAELTGYLLASPRTGSAPFLPVGGCTTTTVVTSDTTLSAGVPLALTGTWMTGRRRPWFRVDGADAQLSSPSAVADIRWMGVRWRDRLVRRIDRLYGERAPLVAALTLARREGMDRTLSDTFARTGIAHLLAISGFHVGIIAGAALALLRLVGVRRRRAGLGAAALSWAYVGLIGFPDAACRAALILALVAISRVRGRPPARWGALATALLILLVLDPQRLAAPGFQLSFAGAAGLVAWGRSFSRSILARTRRRCPRALASALGAGAAATLATLPVVAWHFERVSLVGIPMTLAATPLVAIALPGAIVSLLVDPLSPGAATFLAGGVDTLLALLEWETGLVSEAPWASVWTSRASVVAGVVGCVAGTAAARHPRVGARARRALVGAYLLAALVAWPSLMRLAGLGTLEIVVIDVGQGDAIAVRSPRGRWILIDAGPPDRAGSNPAGHPVVRALRSRGVTRLEALVLTHPDLDHIGGAKAVFSALDVRSVYDPAVVAGKADYLDILTEAGEGGVPWIAARAGQTIELDGAVVEILHPIDSLMVDGETNEASVVLWIRYGDFDALLTGDAYKPTERRIAPLLAGLEVLKVGHHGSDTSTDSLLLARAGPEVALISVGRFNRYGHPAPEVLGRLERAGVSVHRTDLGGTLTVSARRDGSFSIRSERE